MGLGGLFLGTAQHLLDSNGKRATLLRADEREREEGQTRNALAIETGKEAIKARGVLAGFGDDRFIAGKQIDIISLEQVAAEEQSEEGGPGQRGGKKALDSAIAAARSSPARDAQHGDATGHGQHGQRDMAELANGRHRHLALEAPQEWYNIKHWLL